MPAESPYPDPCPVCERPPASTYLRNMHFSGGGIPREEADQAQGKCFGDRECYEIGYARLTKQLEEADANVLRVCTANTEIGSALVDAREQLRDVATRVVDRLDISLEGIEKVMEQFRADTRFLAPGKSIPPEMESEDYRRRRDDAWKAWVERRRVEELAAARAALAIAAPAQRAETRDHVVARLATQLVHARASIAELERKFHAQRAMVEAAHVAFHEVAGVAYGHTPAEDNPASMIRLVAARGQARIAELERLADERLTSNARLAAQLRDAEHAHETNWCPERARFAARIAELESALRRAHGEGCVCVACEKIAPRPRPGRSEP